MRIALVASLVTPLTEAQAGGAQAFVTDLGRSLAARGQDVTVYCAEGSSLPGLRLVTVPAPVDVERALVRPGRIPAPPLRSLREAFTRLFGALREGGHDVVSQHAFDAEAVELAEGLRVLHTLHLPPIVPAVVEAVRRSHARFVTVSEAMRRAWGLPERSSVIPNGVPRFEVPPLRVERKALVAGRISPEKGTAVALRVARRAGLDPLLVGPIYDREYWAREVGIPAASIERPRLWELMAASAVALAPAEWDEPFGLVAAEAQMAGCPVVGYRRGGLPEVVAEAVGGFLVRPGDEDALVAAIPAALALDRRRVRESASRRLDIDVTASRYEVALASLPSKR